VALERVGVEAVIQGLQPYLLGIQKMNATTSGLARSLGTGLKTASTVAAVAIAGAGVAAIGFGAKGLAMADSIEQAELAFGTLLGSVDAAKQRIKELSEFSAATPFELPGIIQADRLLTTFGARSVENLTLVGDAAAGVGAGIEEIAFWFGRAATAIEAGRPFGEALMRLTELGLITGTTRNRLEELQKAGASSTEVMGVLTEELGRFSGLMEKQAQTIGGLKSTLSDNFNLMLASIVQPFMPEFKKGMGAVIEYLDAHKTDVVQFAERSKQAFQDFMAAVGPAWKSLGEDLKDVISFVIINKPAMVAAIVALGAAFAWTKPVAAVIAAISAALTILRIRTEDLPKPLLVLKGILLSFGLVALEAAEGVLRLAEAASDFGNLIGIVGDETETNIDEMLASVIDARRGIEDQLAGIDQEIERRSITTVAKLTEVMAEAARFRALAGLPPIITIGTREMTEEVERMRGRMAATQPTVQGLTTDITDLGASTSGAADKVEEAADSFGDLQKVLEDAAAPADALFSALDKLLGLPTVESAQGQLEIDQKRLQILDATAAAEQEKATRAKRIADLQVQLDRITGKGNEQKEASLKRQIEALQEQKGPQETLIANLQEEIDLLNQEKERRSIVRDIVRDQATLEDARLLTELQIAYIAAGMVGRIGAVTGAYVGTVNVTLQWLGASQQVAGQYTLLLTTLRDIAAVIAAMPTMPVIPALPAGAPAPVFQQGGIVPGPAGEPVTAIVHGGERIIPLGQMATPVVEGTVTQTVSVIGDFIRALPSVYGEVQQVVKRTGDVLITRLGDIAQTIRQKVAVTRIEPAVDELLSAAQSSLSVAPSLPAYQFGGIVPGPIGKPVMAMVHGGEMIVPPSMQMTMPINVTMGETNWSALRTTIHAEVDGALDKARVRTLRGGAFLTGGIG